MARRSVADLELPLLIVPNAICDNSAEMYRIVLTLPIGLVLILGSGFAQSGKATGSARRAATINVIVHAPKDKRVTKDMFDLYDSGIQQEVESFAPIESGSRIVLLVDNSANFKVEVAALQKAALAIINELYEDDQMMVVGYNESAEIIEDMTPDLAKLQAAASKFIKKGFPRLFDALIAVSDALAGQAKTGIEKRAIILISDGYDSGSQTKFDQALGALQEENIILYAIQVQDRTHGALLRDRPKPPAVLEQLTIGTGGAVFPFDKVEQAAKVIADDLRNNWYRLTYMPTGINLINTRRLLLMSREKDVELRTKGAHPGRFRPQ
jgi:Ca-activated chloride channel family protein